MSAKALLPISSTIVFTALIICPSKTMPILKKKLLLFPLLLISVASLYTLFKTDINRGAGIRGIDGIADLDRYYDDFKDKYPSLEGSPIIDLLKAETYCLHSTARICHETQGNKHIQQYCKSLPKPIYSETLEDYRKRVLFVNTRNNEEFIKNHYDIATNGWGLEKGGLAISLIKYFRKIVDIVEEKNMCKVYNEMLSPEYHKHKVPRLFRANSRRFSL